MRVLYKAADTARLGTVTAVADPDLVFSMDPLSSYLIRGQLRFVGSTTGGVKHGFSLGGATLVRGGGVSWKFRAAAADTQLTAEENGAAWVASSLAAAVTRSVGLRTGAYSLPIQFALLLDIGDVGGDFSIIWAQNAADGVTATRLLAGALLTYEKLP